jgi:hypothetical protein
MRRWAWAAAAAALLAAAALRADLAVNRYFDTDESVHLHAALLAAHGNVPFRDFFEQHGPAFPYLLAPVVSRPGDPYAQALAGRALMSVLWALMLLLALRPRPGADPLEGAAAAVLLASFGAFALSSLEVRPDVPAALLLTAAAAAAASGRRSAGEWTGALLGLGLWFSPKLVFAGAGLLAASALRRPGADARAFLARAFLSGAAVGAVGLAWFAARGALRPLWDCYVVFNGKFRRGAAPWPTTLAPSLALNPLTWGLGLGGLTRFRRRPEEAGVLAGALAGLAVSPSAYPQYLLYVAPALAALGAALLADWVRAGARVERRGALAALLLAAAAARPAAAELALARVGNALQRERWACVAARVPPGGRVLDVWGGDSFFRPHAASPWFVPDDVQGMFDPAWLEARLEAGLADPRTRGVIYCESCFARMPAAFVAEVRRLYRPAGCGRLWLRREGT